MPIARRLRIAAAVRAVGNPALTLARTILGVERRLVRRYLAQPGPHGLHVGFGHRVFPGWLNGDINTRRTDALRFDATRRFPLPDACLDHVYSEHMIEHVPYAGGRAMLAECFRVLRPGGRIRIVTPDLQFLVDLAGEPKSELQEAYIHWACNRYVPDAPAPSACFAINNFVRNWRHTFIYDKPTMAHALEASGFREVREYPLNRSEVPQLAGLENETRMAPGFLELESMVFEAEKP